jgi:hypothetical protein
MPSDDLIVLLKVVAGAEELNVLGNQRAPAPRVRNDVVEVQVVRAPALDASTAIAFPHLELHRRRDDAGLIELRLSSIGRRWRCLDVELEAKLEYVAAAVVLCPGVEQPEDA